MSQPPSAAQHAAADGGGFVDEPPRCASAIQLVRPLQSTPETQPQLQPALLRLSAMISQYFTAMDHVFFDLHTAMTKMI
jgi:hypothetical protein